MDSAVSNPKKMMTVTEYARYRGVTAAAVSRAISQGRITRIDGLIDTDVADMEWQKNTDHEKTARAHGRKMEEKIDAMLGTRSTVDYMEWKSRRERAEAIRSEQNQEREAGNLYYKTDVDRGAKTAGRQLRDQLLSVPSRVSAELATMSEAGSIENYLRSELRAVLLTLEKHIMKNGDDDEA